MNLLKTRNEKITFDLYPIEQNKSDFCLKMIEDDISKELFEDIESLNNIIANKELNFLHWNDFVNTKSKQYVYSFSPFSIIENKYLRAGIKKFNIYKLIMQKQAFKHILNVIRCESHIDVSKEILKNICK